MGGKYVCRGVPKTTFDARGRGFLVIRRRGGHSEGQRAAGGRPGLRARPLCV